MAGHATPNGALGDFVTDEQLDLLEEIWLPFFRGQGWPVWDYVARRSYKRAPSLPDAGALWRSFRRIERHGGSPYGAVWSEGRGLLVPDVHEQVGLSIAGLNLLRERLPEAGDCADNLAALVGAIARWERELEPDPKRAITGTRDLEPGIQRWLLDSPLQSLSTDTTPFYDVLLREYAPVRLDIRDDMRSIVNLGLNLAPWVEVRDAGTYLDLLAARPEPRPRPEHSDPLALADMLDHFDLALRADPEWDGEPLLTGTDLRAAGSVALEAANISEFKDRVSNLAIILDRLRVDPIPDQVMKHFGGQQPKSLGRLKYWLEKRFSNAAEWPEVEAAVGDLQQIVRLRVDQQHRGGSLRNEAAVARVRLGLPEVIYDWGAAWSTVRGRAADAFATMRRALRAIQS